MNYYRMNPLLKRGGGDFEYRIQLKANKTGYNGNDGFFEMHFLDNVGVETPKKFKVTFVENGITLDNIIVNQLYESDRIIGHCNANSGTRYIDVILYGQCDGIKVYHSGGTSGNGQTEATFLTYNFTKAKKSDFRAVWGSGYINEQNVTHSTEEVDVSSSCNIKILGVNDGYTGYFGVLTYN